METSQAKRVYYGISLAIVLVMGFVLVQFTMSKAYAVGLEELPGYDNCDLGPLDPFEKSFFVADQPADPISMNTVRSGNIVKTIHAEKEIFKCQLDQGGLDVIVDVTTYIEIYQHIVDRDVLGTSALSITCLKDEDTATVIDCESTVIGNTPVPVGSNCFDEEQTDYITHPQEMNTVSKSITAKTIEAQKEVFVCPLDLDAPCVLFDGLECFNTFKKVEVVLFTDIYEDLSTQTVEEVQFHSMRCVVLMTDEFRFEPDDDLRDATVETCQFSTIDN